MEFNSLPVKSAAGVLTTVLALAGCGGTLPSYLQDPKPTSSQLKPNISPDDVKGTALSVGSAGNEIVIGPFCAVSQVEQGGGLTTGIIGAIAVLNERANHTPKQGPTPQVNAQEVSNHITPILQNNGQSLHTYADVKLCIDNNGKAKFVSAETSNGTTSYTIK
ncbi:hypothetical protein KBC85_00690 [Candidatus Saccharibacteria bacterium]|nr:hypothetical protein [Candidatus Saccharibacteria bacterium]